MDQQQQLEWNILLNNWIVPPAVCTLYWGVIDSINVISMPCRCAHGVGERGNIEFYIHQEDIPDDFPNMAIFDEDNLRNDGFYLFELQNTNALIFPRY